MTRLLIGMGVALSGWFFALGWQLFGSVAAGWLGVTGLVAGGLLMLQPLFDAPTVEIDDDGDEYITTTYTIGEGRRCDEIS